jgi:hypothetical protein
VAKLTAYKNILYDRIWTSESSLCKHRKKFMTNHMKEVCKLDSNPRMQALSSSLNVQTSRFLASVVRHSRHKPEGRRWSFKKKALAVFLLKHVPFSSHYFLYLPDEPYRPF